MRALKIFDEIEKSGVENLSIFDKRNFYWYEQSRHEQWVKLIAKGFSNEWNNMFSENMEIVERNIEIVHN